MIGEINELSATRSYVYDDSAGTATKTVEYDYDVYDRRIAKRVDDNVDGTFDRTYRYVYDGEDIVLVNDGTGSLENRYLHGPGIDEVFADEDALGEILWALGDNQGTVRDWAERDGATGATSVVNHVTYDAFGEITGQTSATHEPLYAYTGREWDPDAGMYYYRARWYDAAVGRFASEDPIGFEAGDPNLSRYVRNSPTNSTDPTGTAEYPSFWRSYWNRLFPWNNPNPPVDTLDRVIIGAKWGSWGTGLGCGAAAGGMAAAGVSGPVLFGGSTAGGLTTVSTAAGAAHISTAGGIATVEVGFVQSITPALVRAIAQAARAQGARSAILNTGPVINSNLAIRLGLAAQTGQRILGARVRLISGGKTPIFELIWDSLSNCPF